MRSHIHIISLICIWLWASSHIHFKIYSMPLSSYTLSYLKCIFSATMGNHPDMCWCTAVPVVLHLLRVQTMLLQEAQEEGRQEGAERGCRPEECTVARQLHQGEGTGGGLYNVYMSIGC